jgi:hypothetical protein
MIWGNQPIWTLSIEQVYFLKSIQTSQGVLNLIMETIFISHEINHSFIKEDY